MGSRDDVDQWDSRFIPDSALERPGFVSSSKWRKEEKKTVSNSGVSVIVMTYMECRNTTKNGADNTCPLTASLE